MISRKWFSRYGFILPNSKQEDSENGVLFSVELAFLRDDYNLNRQVRWKILDLWLSNPPDYEYRTVPNSPNPRFSLDNLKAVAAFSRWNMKDIDSYWNGRNLKALPLFNKHTIRPDTFCFLLYCKYPLLGFWFLWVPALFMISSCVRPYHETSGKLLAYVQYKGANMRLTWWICKKLIGVPMHEVFAVYFPESDHPINVEARRVFK